MKLLSDRIEEFIAWMKENTDFGDWNPIFQEEVHKALIVFMISDPKETDEANEVSRI